LGKEAPEAGSGRSLDTAWCSTSKRRLINKGAKERKIQNRKEKSGREAN